ncbi:BtrH N-terminal domain-containing protein [Sinosporangium album]|uniref:BtrH N-terminal domain-containing protein n=1 Tax=Sinosporangium album TaxID=504805 RepID=UPI000B859539|nr:BtrH N-terminal domain-containing protein [Sinosporangium album]
MIVSDIEPRGGLHCETSTLGVLLRHRGVDLSEPMLFGLGEGLGFIYWDAKNMDMPFLGGRIKPFHLTRQVVARLGGLELRVLETSSERKAWNNLTEALESGSPVGLQLDCYHLGYFTTRVHFAGHFVAAYGFSATHAHLVDTAQQGGAVTATLDSLRLARAERGPMAARNRSFTVTGSAARELREVLAEAIKRNAHAFLEPPITNLGHKGIAKAARQMRGWTDRDPAAIARTAAIMEYGGTGGALFRNMYRDFLGECAALVDDPAVHEGHHLYGEIAKLWTEAIAEIAAAAENPARLTRASDMLAELSRREHDAMRVLAQVAV